MIRGTFIIMRWDACGCVLPWLFLGAGTLSKARMDMTGTVVQGPKKECHISATPEEPFGIAWRRVQGT